MTKKQYVAPAAEPLTLQAQGVLCLSNYGQNGKAGGNAGFNNPLIIQKTIMVDSRRLQL